ncbi:MAG: preprotein translocase subunit YajC [Pseudomonadota bacterium]
MLISPAFAQTGATPSGLEMFLPLILIFVVFYFLLIRPQQKKAKRHREMVGALRRGDKIITAGGILGTIAKIVDENEVLVEIADNVRVRVAKATIGEVLSKPEPVANDDKAKSD